jgi:chromosome partitioning protein
MIVALFNQQGGVGKTTLALHLAGVWACQGQRVAVVDADPDACALEWSELRAQATLPSRFDVTAIPRDTLHRELLTLARDVDRAIVDGPSHIEAITRSALMAADFVLVPVQPPPFQGSAFVETLRLANGMMTVRRQLRIRLVLNRCNARASVTRDLTQALADYDPPALISTITERAVLAEAMERGRFVFELPHSTVAVHEVTALAAEVERIVS